MFQKIGTLPSKCLWYCEKWEPQVAFQGEDPLVMEGKPIFNHLWIIWTRIKHWKCFDRAVTVKTLLASLKCSSCSIPRCKHSCLLNVHFENYNAECNWFFLVYSLFLSATIKHRGPARDGLQIRNLSGEK